MTIQQEEDTEKTFLSINDIMTLIPHRYPFLLIDSIRDIIKGKSATGIKNVTYNEPFFPGHFPTQPIMPGVLIVEAMAQTAGALVVHSMSKSDKNRLVYFMTIENAKFRRPVVPGDQLHIKVQALQNRRNVWKFEGKAYVDEQLVAEAHYSAMIVE